MELDYEYMINMCKNFKEAEVSELSDDVAERERKKAIIQEKLSKDKIKELDEGDLRELIRNLWSFQIWTNKDYLVDQMTVDGLDNVRDTFKESLYESSSDKDAFQKLIDNIRMMGPASASEILCTLYPDKYALWNRKVKDAYNHLSKTEVLPRPIKQQWLNGEKYNEFNKIMHEIKTNLEDNGCEIEDFLELDYFMYYILDEKNDESEKALKEDFNHDNIKGLLQELGDGLGFDVDTEYPAAEGARLDVIWSSKIANLGKIAYAFEVQKSGKRDSAILNLQKAKTSDPSIQKLVIVSDKEQIDKFKGDIGAIGGDISKYISYMEVSKVIEAVNNLSELKNILKDTGLTE